MLAAFVVIAGVAAVALVHTSPSQDRRVATSAPETPAERPRGAVKSPLPNYYSNVESGKAFRRLADRGADQRALTVAEVFAGSARTPSYRHVRFTLRGSRVETRCAAAVWGEQLEEELKLNGCSQVVRGVYADTRGQVVGVVVIFNMKDVEGATAIIEALDPLHDEGFVLPPGRAGPAGLFGRGYSEAHAHAMGHYVFVRWAEHLGSPTRERARRDVGEANVALTDAQGAIRRRLLAAD